MDYMKDENLVLDASATTDKQGNPILGKLSGVCADCFAPTRNGRLYSEQLWEKVFSDPLIKERFECGGILGELDHPADRLETDTSKVAVCMPEPPKKNDKGQLVATFDILNTPNGKIVYTLAKYGYKLGISSRGDGELERDFDGNESVQPNSYQLEGFDIVLMPAVKAARLSMTESIQQSFSKAICEALDNASVDDRKIMSESLDKLNISYTPVRVENISEDNNIAVANDQAVVKDLQKALKEKLSLEKQVRELQEQLSVCNTKVTDTSAQLARYKTSVKTLSENARLVTGLKSQVNVLTEQVNKLARVIDEKDKVITALNESKKESARKQAQLKESLAQSSNYLSTKEQQLRRVDSQLASVVEENEKKIAALNENLTSVQKDASIKCNEYEAKLKNQKRLVENYQSFASKVLNKYIDCKAQIIGVSPQEIKNRLTEKLSVTEIDKVCESLQKYKININKLPFDLSSTKKATIKVTESYEPIKGNTPYDDDVDDNLLNLVRN